MGIISSFAQQKAVALQSALKKTIVVLCVAGSIAGGAANAQWEQGLLPVSSVPRAASFIGLGGSYNAANFGDQNVFAQGVSNVYLAGVLVAFGAAGGPADPYFDTQTTLAPTLQFGYFQHFTGSRWLWGAKFSYSNLAATSTNHNVIIPQVGAFTSATPDTFTGNVVVRSYRTSLDHQIVLMPFVGRSFEKSFVYLGAGPTLAQMDSHLNGVIGFADINGVHTNITGTPSNFSSSPWVFGGAATVGATYFLDSSWFLDLSYTFGMTQVKKTSFSAPFSSTSSGYVDTGILSGTYSGRVITQAFTISINRAF